MVFWIYSKTWPFSLSFLYNENFIICCVPAQILYLGKIFFLRYRPKCSEPVKLLSNELFLMSKLSKSCLWSLNFTVSQEWVDRINCFFACWYKFMQIKRWSKILEVKMVKNGCAQSFDGTLKLSVSEEWTDGIKWFFARWWRYTKIQSWSKIYFLGMVKNGHG